MKKLLTILFLFICIMLVACSNKTEIKHPYTQEYVAGEGNIKGDVDIDKYAKINTAFEIGASDDGYAVFKDPLKAFQVLLENYAVGIDLIKNEYDLDPLTTQNYELYKTYGWQITGGTDEEKEQAAFVSKFLDIYENSFGQQ